MIEYQNFITIDPNRRFGKPCVRNTRISVFDVLSWLASGMPWQQIIADYPELTLDDVKACLLYAADKERKARVA